MKTLKTQMLVAAAVAALTGAASAPAWAAAETSRVVVAFKAGAKAQILREIAQRRGKVEVDLSELNAFAVTLPASAVERLKRHPRVEFVEPDHIQRQMASDMPSTGDPYALGQTVPYGIPMVQADMVDDADAGNRTLCIIDSGIDGSHPDLAGNKLAGENLTTSGTWDSDESGHGSHVAGTVAAINQAGVGVVGLLPNKMINLYIAKVFDASGSTRSSTVAKAMMNCWRNGNANIISMSLGGEGASSLQQRAGVALARNNVLMLAAAGNDGNNAVSYPAGQRTVMAVAAVDSDMNHAAFSQTNRTVEIAGPGVATLSTVPVGSGLEGSLEVAGSPVDNIPMEGSPTVAASGPLADFGLGDTPAAGSMTGKVCLISRGAISFADKVLNCQDSGGVAAVIYNNVAGPLNGTLGATVTTIPSLGTTQDDGTTMLTQIGQTADVAVTGNDYALFNGTSMATPHVSAVAALVWSKHPGCTALEIRKTLGLSALDLGPAGRDRMTGHGLVQAKAAVDRIAANGCGL